MPIYEYICSSCNTKFDMLRSMSQSADKADCPSCEKPCSRTITRFSCLSKYETGFTAPVGGSSCSGCTSSSCGTCDAV